MAKSVKCYSNHQFDKKCVGESTLEMMWIIVFWICPLLTVFLGKLFNGLFQWGLTIFTLQSYSEV